MMAKSLHFFITSLDSTDKPAILAHLLRLDSTDRYMRFFAPVNDSAIENYVSDMIDLDTQKGFGIYAHDHKTLIAFAHITGHERIENGAQAELGISVDKEYRGHGLAQRLMARILVYCKSHDIHTLYMSCLRENKAMQHLARKSGLRVILDHTEALAELKMVEYPMEKLASVSHEIAYEQVAILDKCYRMSKNFVEKLLETGKYEAIT